MEPNLSKEYKLGEYLEESRAGSHTPHRHNSQAAQENTKEQKNETEQIKGAQRKTETENTAEIKPKTSNISKYPRIQKRNCNTSIRLRRSWDRWDAFSKPAEVQFRQFGDFNKPTKPCVVRWGVCR